MAFAQLQSRVSATAIRRLGAVALLAGVPVQGVFDNGFALADVGQFGMASTQPAWVMLTVDVPPKIVDLFTYIYEPTDALDMSITIDHKVYRISAHESDGCGVSRLLLEVA